MKVKNGTIFYKMVIHNEDTTKNELINFFNDKGINENQIERLKQSADNIKLSGNHFECNVNVKEEETILLFKCDMDSSEFADFIEGYFE